MEGARRGRGPSGGGGEEEIVVLCFSSFLCSSQNSPEKQTQVTVHGAKGVALQSDNSAKLSPRNPPSNALRKVSLANSRDVETEVQRAEERGKRPE